MMLKFEGSKEFIIENKGLRVRGLVDKDKAQTRIDRGFSKWN